MNTAKQQAAERSLVNWVVRDRQEALDLIRELRSQLELDARVSARSMPTLRRTEAFLERVEAT